MGPTGIPLFDDLLPPAFTARFFSGRCGSSDFRSVSRRRVLDGFFRCRTFSLAIIAIRFLGSRGFSNLDICFGLGRLRIFSIRLFANFNLNDFCRRSVLTSVLRRLILTFVRACFRCRVGYFVSGGAISVFRRDIALFACFSLGIPLAAASTATSTTTTARRLFFAIVFVATVFRVGGTGVCCIGIGIAICIRRSRLVAVGIVFRRGIFGFILVALRATTSPAAASAFRLLFAALGRAGCSRSLPRLRLLRLPLRQHLLQRC